MTAPRGEALPYTHEFLSEMLGANRKSVTMAAQALQTAGLISYRRGKIQVVDRAALEKASCECYAIVKEGFDAFLTPSLRDLRTHCSRLARRRRGLSAHRSGPAPAAAIPRDSSRLDPMLGAFPQQTAS
jgi:Crp-like helix-turn-helix domain